MSAGTCPIIIDGTEAGKVQYKYDKRGSGKLWIAIETLMDAFHSENVCLRINDIDLEIIVTSATPGEAAPFAFKSWPLS